MCSCDDDTGGVVVNIILNVAFYMVGILKRTSSVPGISLALHALVTFTVQQQETLDSTVLGLQAWFSLELWHRTRLSQ